MGDLECRAWETYYRRKWLAFLVASVGLVRAAFRMSWPRTLVGAWLVLRANQVWAPFPDNDPDGRTREAGTALFLPVELGTLTISGGADVKVVHARVTHADESGFDSEAS